MNIYRFFLLSKSKAKCETFQIIKT